MSVFPIPTTRTTGLLMQSQLLAQLNDQQLDIQRLQSQISTGRRISRPSEDAPAAQRAQTLQRLLELKAQAQRNLEAGQSYLDATDAALANVSSILIDVRGLAVEAASDTSTETNRQAIAAEVQRAIEQLVVTGNQNFRGRYLFAGSGAAAPFSRADGYVLYSGNQTPLDSFVDLDLAYATNAPGTEVFGAYSTQVQGTVDLNPALSADTPLADLLGGQGIRPGSIQLSDGTSRRVIDLSTAATVGDVARLIERNPPEGRTVTVQITSTGLVVAIDSAPGTNLSIKEVAGGTTASDLKLLTPLGAGIGPIVGGDLNPRLRLTTPLANLASGGPPLDLTSGLVIQNGGRTYTIDTSAAQTVEELLTAINHSGAGVLAEIAPSGDRLVVRSRLSGADLSIGENGGSTATQLGIRSLTSATALADLNHGAGVGQGSGTDFTIRRKDGTLLDIDLGSAATIGDVLAIINNHPANLDPPTRVVARLAAVGNGIELFDGNTAATGTLQVARQFGSTAAWDLGLVPRGSDAAAAASSAAGDTLTGADPNPQEVRGVFNSLLRLHEALVHFDRGQLERAAALLDEDINRLNLARGDVGARSRTLDTLQSHLTDEEILLKGNLSDEIDTDLAEAISGLVARQSALQASLQLAAGVFKTSLLDFL